jgi:hypothetical protein
MQAICPKDRSDMKRPTVKFCTLPVSALAVTPESSPHLPTSQISMRPLILIILVPNHTYLNPLLR